MGTAPRDMREAAVPSCNLKMNENFSRFHLASFEHNASSAERILSALGANIRKVFETAMDFQEKSDKLKFRMLRRYRKIEVDSRFSAAEDRGHYSVSGDASVKLMSSVFFYLLLTPFIYKASKACET